VSALTEREGRRRLKAVGSGKGDRYRKAVVKRKAVVQEVALTVSVFVLARALEGSCGRAASVFVSLCQKSKYFCTRSASAEGLPGRQVVGVGRQRVKARRHSCWLLMRCLVVPAAATSLAHALAGVSFLKAVDALRRRCGGAEGRALGNAVSIEASGTMAGEAARHVEASSLEKAVVRAV